MNKIRLNIVDEDLFYHKLENGLDIYLLPNNNVDKFYITLNTKYGSINTNFKYNGKEYSVPKGVAHYLEHLNFNMEEGTAHDYYSKLGSIINAYTSFDVTSYNVKGNQKFKENLEYLIKYVFTPYFTKDLVNSERGVILEEVKMYEDLPDTVAFYKIFDNLFVNDERKYQVGGTVKDVKSIKLDDIKVSYDAYYSPSNMFMVITGNFIPEEALAIISNQFSSLNVSSGEVLSIYPKEPSKVFRDEEEIELLVDKPKVLVGLKIPRSNFKSLKLSDRIIKIYLNLILKNNFGNTSSILEELQKGKIVDDLDYAVFTTLDYYVIVFSSNTLYPDYFIDRVMDLWNNLEVSSDDISRISKVFISEYSLLFDYVEAVNSYLLDSIVDYDRIEEDLPSLYRNLNYDECCMIINKLKKYNKSILKVKPKNRNL